jgi:hypothetical protein
MEEVSRKKEPPRARPDETDAVKKPPFAMARNISGGPHRDYDFFTNLGQDCLRYEQSNVGPFLVGRVDKSGATECSSNRSACHFVDEPSGCGERRVPQSRRTGPNVFDPRRDLIRLLTCKNARPRDVGRHLACTADDILRPVAFDNRDLGPAAGNGSRRDRETSVVHERQR